jgi:hypothetical protein
LREIKNIFPATTASVAITHLEQGKSKAVPIKTSLINSEMSMEENFTQVLVYLFELQKLLEKNKIDMNAIERQFKKIEAIKPEPQRMVIKSMKNIKTELISEKLESFKEIR